MTAFAFILGTVPLAAVATGSGAVSAESWEQRSSGGMLAATFISIFRSRCPPSISWKSSSSEEEERREKPPPKPSPAPPVDGVCERLAKAVERAPSDYGLFPGDPFSLDGSCFGWDMVDEGSINSSCGSSIFSFSRLGLSSASFFGFMPVKVGEETAPPIF